MNKLLLCTALSGIAVPALLQGLADDPDTGAPFRRVSTFNIFENTGNVDDETVAEIVAATADGMTLVYTDSETERLGFVDITSVDAPVGLGAIDLPGEPTAVSVRGRFALAAVNTSADFVNTSGSLEVVDIDTQTIVRSIPLGGQPDSTAISPDGRFLAIAIENERDEKLGSGEPPQLPAGFLTIVDLTGPNPANWTTRDVQLTGVADLFPEDPEPEFVDINRFNIAAVTLQENNHIVLVSLELGVVLGDFSAGTVDLDGIDIEEEDVISQTGALSGVPREPDAVTWVGDFALATADEGDLFGGSRGFTTWSIFGSTFFEAGSTVEDAVTRIGHYPENRSENKGNEPEGIEYARFPDGTRYLFVGSERSSVVLVYRIPGNGLAGVSQPEFVQVLPAGVGPEGIVAIPSRNLLVVASEVDDRGDKIRSSLMLYTESFDGNYPSIVSAERTGATTPIPWGALSGLAVDRSDANTLYTVADSFYERSRVLEIDRSSFPAVITKEYPIVDSHDLIETIVRRIKFFLPNADDFLAEEIMNADGTVNLDLEGISTSAEPGVFWVATEGAGNLENGVSDPGSRPFESPNLVLKLEMNAAGDALDITRVLGLPTAVSNEQLRFGFEGVTEAPDGSLYVAFQREWSGAGDPDGQVRIARFDGTTGRWSFAYYPLDTPTSPNGGWVGLSEIAALPDGDLAILERDNQGGPDARIKRIYRVDPSSVTFVEEGAGPLPLLAKTLVSDLLSAGIVEITGGVVFEKFEGLAVDAGTGDAFIVNDNDGVDDNSGETRLFRLPGLFQATPK